jgi:hypothetical protein
MGSYIYIDDKQRYDDMMSAHHIMTIAVVNIKISEGVHNRSIEDSSNHDLRGSDSRPIQIGNGLLALSFAEATRNRVGLSAHTMRVDAIRAVGC